MIAQIFMNRVLIYAYAGACPKDESWTQKNVKIQNKSRYYDSTVGIFLEKLTTFSSDFIKSLSCIHLFSGLGRVWCLHPYRRTLFRSHPNNGVFSPSIPK